MGPVRADRSRSPRGRPGEVDDVVLDLIVQRERARSAKDWSASDSLRTQLQDMGITLLDKTKHWKSADGRSGRIPSFDELEAMGTAEAKDLAARDTPPQPPPLVPLNEANPEVAQIKQLVHMREQARAAKDWNQSDDLRDQMKGMGVELMDKEKLWRTSTGLSGIIVGFTGGKAPSDREITILVYQREMAREKGDWSTADMIRDELRQLGVDIKDKQKVWTSSDGRSGDVPAWSGGGGPAVVAGGHPGLHAAAAAPRGGAQQTVGGAPDLRRELLQAALQAAQHPVTAAQALQALNQINMGAAQLLGGMSQAPPPAHRAAAAGQGLAAPAALPASAEVPEVQEATRIINQLQAQNRAPLDHEIEWLIQVREKVRHAKDYACSDSLRDIMRTSLGIQMQEKEKRWTTRDGRSGVIPLWDAILG